MLKPKIVEILKESLPSDQEKVENFEHIADRIIEASIPEISDAVAKALGAYIDSGAKENE